MKYLRQSLAFVLAFGVIGSATAATTAEEAKQLGTTLTALGAQKAANADGSIQEFTNTPIAPPADYKSESGYYPDPFKDEKPLVSIDASNMDQYVDKLSEGTKQFLKRWPSYRIDVYPSHRTVTYSQWVAENTLRNATSAKLVADTSGVEDAYGGIPFPIPKNGAEVIWNSYLFPTPTAVDSQSAGYLVDQTGRVTQTSVSYMYKEFPYYDTEATSLEGLSYFKFLSNGVEPARTAGNKSLGWYSIDYSKQDFLVWQYTTGQRRVRMAPETKYDALSGASGQMFDEFHTYSGQPDKYDWKLIGKQEMYIPYNPYRAVFGDAEKDITPQHFNPDALRWELHRVWVVEGNLKPGQSHSKPKRVFYVDEDTWAIALADSYNSDGELSRVIQALTFEMYGNGEQNSTTYVGTNIAYNLEKGSYVYQGHYNGPGLYVLPVEKRDPSETSSDTMGGSGIR